MVINASKANLKKNQRRQATNKSSIASKYVGKGNQLLTLIPSKSKINRIKRYVRCFDKQTCAFVEEFELVRINQKYLQNLFELAENDQVLYSYPITQKQQVFIEKLAGLKLDLDNFDYFMEHHLNG